MEDKSLVEILAIIIIIAIALGIILPMFFVGYEPKNQTHYDDECYCRRY